MSDDLATYCNGKTDASADAPTEDPGPHAGEGYCKRPAGWGTDHAGEGRCKLHGGKAGAPTKHGLYSAKRERLQERYEKAMGNDRPGSLRAEVAVLRALLSDFLEDVEEVDSDTINAATKLQGELRKTLDTISTIQNREAPSTEEVEALMDGVAQIISEYVDESRQKEAIDELRSLALNGRWNRHENGRAAV